MYSLKRTILCFVFLLSFYTHGQIVFEKSYFIDNNDEKTECFIKNMDWVNNPETFEYKLNNDSEIQIGSIDNIKAFGIYDYSKFVRAKVKIDRSSSEISKIGYVKEPESKEEVLFLKVLIEGDYSLYRYYDHNLKRYFFSENKAHIEPLIFNYYKNEFNKVGENKRFKQQLLNSLKCPSFSVNTFKHLDYEKQDLIRVFEDYNKCKAVDYTNFEEKPKKDLFNLNVRLGLNYASLNIKNSASDYRDADFDGAISLRTSIEIEVIIPFNKNKWALLVEPTYQYYKSEAQTNRSTQVARVDYSSIELPLGIRHYFFLNDESKLFFNGAYIFDFSGDSSINFDNVTKLDIDTRHNLALGFGYKHQNKYGVELRYHTNRDLLTSNSLWDSKYKTISLIFGYTLF